jgi:N-acetylglucosamine-6-phosphate deacetylase
MPNVYRGHTLAGEAVEVTVDGGAIASVKPFAGEAPLLIAPPLVDLQQNGALGYSFNRVSEQPEGLRTIAAHVRRHGVGRMLATFTTFPYEPLLESLAEFDRQLSADGDLARLIFGAFSEGIYVSRATGWRGAHNPQFMRDPSWSEWARMQEASGGRFKVFNVAPELPRAVETIREAVRHRLRVSMGHCGPKPEQIRRAVDAGADLVTHFGNAAPIRVHRHHNPFWTWLAERRLHLGLIADGHHLPGDVIRAAVAAKGAEKVYLVSDATAYSGMPAGDYGTFVIEENRRCHVKRSELLAGNWFQADRCVEFMCELGWSLEDAWRQQSTIPARIIGLTPPGIAAGQPAEFVVANWTGDGLRLEQVVSMGKELLDSPVSPRMV